MRASNVNFKQKQNLQHFLLLSVYNYTLQLSLLTNGVPKVFYDDLQFPIDRGLKRNSLLLKSDAAIVYKRAQTITTPMHLRQR